MVSEDVSREDGVGMPHTGEDKVEFVDFAHVLQQARVTLGWVFEVGFAGLE